MTARVLIVDDHPIVRHGLAVLIDEQEDLQVCAETGDPQEALRVADAEGPDVVLVDLSLGNASGLDLIKDLKARRPDVPVLVVSIHSEETYAERALRAGASGYVPKQTAIVELLTAIRKVLAGGLYTSETVATRLLMRVRDKTAGKDPIDLLSDRELHVFRLIGQGRSTRQIAESLHRSVKTIETHRARIKGKLGLKNATELIQQATRWIQDQADES